jgi:nitrate/nitrite-specific signal transduction histidine kinase
MDLAVNNATIAFCVVGHLAMIATGIVCLFRGDQSARYYLVAWSFFAVGGLLRLAGLKQIIPPSSFLATHGMQIGSAFEVTLFALGLGYRYNAMSRERERLRLRIASDLHDDIGSGLTQITLNSELLRRAADPKAAELAEQIGAQAHALALTMRDIVWSIEPKQDSWEALELRMKDYAIGLLGPAGITLDMQGELRFEHKTLPVEVRQNVLMLFKEVVHNAVKHARCTEFKVRWRLDRKTLWMQFQDNGQGFDPEIVKNGHGLGSIRRRASAVSGQLVMEAACGQPTTITVEVPLQEEAFTVQAE